MQFKFYNNKSGKSHICNILYRDNKTTQFFFFKYCDLYITDIGLIFNIHITILFMALLILKKKIIATCNSS